MKLQVLKIATCKCWKLNLTNFGITLNDISVYLTLFLNFCKS